MTIFLKFKNLLERTRRFLKSERFLDVLTICIVIIIISTIIFLHILLSTKSLGIFCILILVYAISFLVYQTIILIKKGKFKKLWKNIHKCLLTSKNTAAEWIYGKRYFVRINKTWSVQRAKRLKRNDPYRRIVVRYGPDKHKWILETDDYEKISSNIIQSVMDELVIKMNVAELKRHNRSTHDNAEDLNPLYYYRNR